MNYNLCMTIYSNRFGSILFKMDYQSSSKFWQTKSSNTCLFSVLMKNFKKYKRSLYSQVNHAKKVGHNIGEIALISPNATKSGKCRKKDGS